MARKKKSVVKDGHYDKELARYASENASVVISMEDDSISTSGCKFTYHDQILDDELEVAIVGSLFTKEFYEEAYSKGNPTTPTCYAYSTHQEDSTFSPENAVQNPQAKTCEECEYNQWGSSDTGVGKACGDKVRLLVVPKDKLNSLESLLLADMAILRVPSTSIKYYNKYLKTVESAFKRPLFAVITNISFDTEFDYPMLNFNLVEKVSDNEVLGALIEGQAKYKGVLSYSYTDQGGSSGQANKKGKKKGARKGKKKGSLKKKQAAKKKVAKKKKTVAKKKAAKKKKRF